MTGRDARNRTGHDSARRGSARHETARPDGPRLRTGSLRARTVVAVLVLLALLLAGLAVAVEATLGQRLRAQVEDRLRDRASAAAALVGTVDGDDLADRLSAQGLSVVIRDADGGAIVAGPSPDELREGPPALGDGDGLPAGPGRDAGGAGTGTPTGDATAGPAAPGEEATGASSDAGAADDTAADAVTVTASDVTADDEVTTLVSELSDGSTITLTADSSSVGQTLTQLRWVMLGASGVFLVVAAAGLVLVVRATLRPLDRMTAVARSIAHGDRGRRLRPAKESTEIGRVATAFDEMLDGVEGAERTALEAERTALAAERTALEAEQRVRAFVSDAAHELRTPVAGMRAAADTLVRSSADVGPDERERLAVHVVREAARASRLIDDMLLMARVDRGLELDVAPVDVEALVTSVVEGQRLRRPGLELRVEVRGAGAGAGPGALVVLGDAGRLAQVLGNLVDNAARATHGTGTVVLTVECSSSEAAAVLIADDGPGVPEADRERVFDRLVRLDAARRTGDGGAGLGLPIARGIARAHGGDLVCEPGGAAASGAVFRLTLPLPR
ncbi:HAMP domain-containing sensor histidine kinase [Frigoribacterium sp. PhB107]|uniref:sensor histidine kinase n=1 Tax=Frigoribacterium sp. PhB107 TaxID=2485172 RepID=UPI000F491127|nr:HAMP domain-containing sensor histidine kinase [Frigoribacterium sp. PhB107]